MSGDSVVILNIVFCSIIFISGVLVYIKRRFELALFVGLAYGIFTVSHILTITGLAEDIPWFMFIIRLIAYFLIVTGLLRLLMKKPASKKENKI